jgi:hypothetical protein
MAKSGRLGGSQLAGPPEGDGFAHQTQAIIDTGGRLREPENEPRADEKTRVG